MPHIAFDISREDVSAFSEELASGQIIHFEDFTKDLYLDAVIDKPWGHEYRIYADMLIDVWKLMLAPGQSTSMHCHPRKETVLMCLGGHVQINFLTRSVQLEAGQFARIPKGVFHSTDNVGSADAHLVEVETPRNKFDLVRKTDRYGRQGRQYETGPSTRAISDLREDPSNPYSKIRHEDLQGLFSFEVLTGARIKEQKQTPDFSISLSIEAAISQRIDIFRSSAADLPNLRPDARYLALTRI